MIKLDKIKIKVNPNSRMYYNSLGYNCVNYDIIEIHTLDLPPGSNIYIEILCDNCGAESTTKYNKYYKSTNGSSNNNYCKKCSHIKAKETKLERYGDENYHNILKAKETKLERYGDENYTNREKSRNTCKTKYGYENVSQVSDIKEKKVKTCLENHLCENPFQSEEIKSKIRETNLNRWGNKHYLLSDDAKNKYNEFCEKLGVSHYSKSDDYKEKIEKTSMYKWGVKHIFQSSDIQEKISKTNYIKYGFDNVMRNKDISLMKTKEFVDSRNLFFNNLGYEYINYDFDEHLYKLKKISCKHEFNINYDLFRSRIKYNNDSCLICYPKNELSSIKEKEMFNWLKTFNLDIIENDRTLIGKEIDIYLPDFKIGIEFNGLYYHSDKFKEKTYHIDKSNRCKEVGIELMHIWEDDWVYRKEIVKSIILNKLNLNTDKIYARKCKVRVINSKISKEFLNNNHIQGSTTSSIQLGLYFDDYLVSVMTFGNRRINSKNSFELIRFCNIINTNIIGAASKLFNYLLNTYNVTDIVSYSDISLFSGDLYEKLGFENNGKTSLNYYWTDLKNKYHRFNFNKKKLIKMGYDRDLTEEQIMKNIGYYKIWSCGQIRWIYSR